MAKGHWSRLRAKGMGPRGGGKGAQKGPLRKIVRNRKVYTVSALPRDKGGHWRDWVEIVATEDYDLSREKLREAMAGTGEGGKWKDVRFSEGGWQEVLECGHAQPPVHDLIGETNAARRRCAKCKRGAPADVPPEAR